MIKPSRSLPLGGPWGPRLSGTGLASGENIANNAAGSSAARNHRTLCEETGAAVSDALPTTIPDIALVLVLDEIVHQASSISAAINAAVVRIQDGIPVSKTASNVSSSCVAAHLTQCSASCWKAGRPQLCQDVEIDRRFDSHAFLRLGVRSFVVMPVRNQDKTVIAILEGFSASAQAFHHADLLLLKRLAGRTAKHIAIAEQALICQMPASRSNEVAAAPQRAINLRRPLFSNRPRPFAGEVWNLLLGGSIIFVAILLGWALGRTKQQDIRPLQLSAAVPHDARPESGAAGLNTVADEPVKSAPQTSASSMEGEDEKSETNRAIHGAHSTPSKSLTKRSKAPVDDVVIFEDGKQIFPRKSKESDTAGDDRHDAGQRLSEAKDAESPVHVPEQAAEQRLVRRIEPEYPEHAREQRLQGTVVLNVFVDKQGAVSSLSRVSGDTQLTLLAAKAVRLWKFAPLVRDGAPVSFESQITLDFTLP